MRKKVCIVTGARSDYGLLRETIRKFNNNKEIDFKLVVTGSHLSSRLGNTYKEISKDGFVFDKVKINLGDGSKKGMSLAISNVIKVFTDYFDNYKPDILILLGDRYEIFGVAIAARILSIKIAHISGGDITEGAIDDVFRNSITQMSSLHFPGCEDSKKRIVSMGKATSTVFNVGEPGIENCLNIEIINKKELSKIINFNIEKDYAIVTYHPETNSNTNIKKDLKELIRAMNTFDMGYIITKANADAGGTIINDLWKKECSKHSNWLLVSSLGVNKYINCLRNAKLVIGNSSSGIVEAPTLGIPTVNIGTRQKGRMMAKSVINCDAKENDIAQAITKAMKLKHKKYFLYGNVNTSEKIVNYILKDLKK